MKRRQLICSLSISLVLAALLLTNIFSSDAVEYKTKSAEMLATRFEDIPKLMLPVLAERMGSDDTSYHLQKDGIKITGITEYHGIRSEFGKSGVTFSKDNHDISMRFSGSSELDPIKVSPNKVEYYRGNITEWYVNSPLGVEQGFTLEKAPKDRNPAGGVVIELDLVLSEELRAQQGQDANTINFVSTDKQNVILNYSKLFAYDMTGRELSSNMKLRDSKIEITVDDSNAQYPIVIDPFIEFQKILASDIPPGSMFGQFGGTVHISGNTAIVGAIGVNGFSGQAYIFDRDDNTGFWSETQILTPSNAMASYFGNCVHIDGDTAIVGALNLVGGTQGEAFIFERDSMTNMWSEVDSITGSTGAPGDFYGISCSVEESSGIAMVGANRAFSVEGRAYVYERDMIGMWPEVQVLTPSGAMAGFNFGFKLNFQDDTAAVGAFGANRVYIYERDMLGVWIEDDILTGSDSVIGDSFGVDVDFDGDNMVIGASEFNSDQGKAYFFERDMIGNWNEIEIVTSPVPIAGEFFGSNVSISGDIAIISAPLLITSTGRVFVFERDGLGIWNNVQTLDPSDGMPGDSFGVEVSLDGHQLIVGAAGEDDGSAPDLFTGAAYLYGNDVTLDVNIIGTGSGTVTSMPVGIDCGSMINDCTEDYNYQTLVTLTADPDVGSTFVGWSDDCSGIMEDTTILMLDDSLCTAEFEIAQVTLDVIIQGSGEGGVLSTNPGIDCNSIGIMDCDEVYNFGDMVTLTATPLPNSDFAGWSGDCSAAGMSPIVMLTMDQSLTCIAEFIPGLRTLSIDKEGLRGGRVTSMPPGIDCGLDCSESYVVNTEVTLTVNPDPVSDFLGWTGDCSGTSTMITVEVTENLMCIALFGFKKFVLNPIFPALDDNVNSITAEQADPEGTVAFIWGMQTGSFTIGGNVCNGTEIGIRNPRLLAIKPANDFGIATNIFYIPFFSDFEFEVQLQAVDVRTCRTSNIVTQVIRKDEDG